MNAKQLLERLFGSSAFSEERLITMVNEGFEQGKLLDSEAAMIQNIFSLGDKDARDIMTQRKNILALEKQTTLREAMDQMLTKNKSRFPVYEENLNAIVGVLHLRDAIHAYMDPGLLDWQIDQIEGMIREAVFIPENKNIGDLFRSMQREKNQMVVVVDEYGQTAGLVAMEDILEEIVGSILDEHDEDEAYIEATEDQNRFIIEGKTPLEELEERFGISFAEEEFETLNGFLISRMDRIPDEGEEFSIDIGGYNFKIQTVENHMIASVLVTRLEQQ
ncbi:MAG: hemolysin family protein [Lachnospiraceae bacterium]|jgi:putative hemolysin|nr:hemolysin family protein [Lachnospiraceae bacterium]